MNTLPEDHPMGQSVSIQWDIMMSLLRISIVIGFYQ